MRITSTLLLALVLLAACGDPGGPPAQPKVFTFDSGGAGHIEGHGAWQVEATQGGAFAVKHVVGKKLRGWEKEPLAEADEAALWKAIDGVDLASLRVEDRPGVPDEVKLTFGLAQKGQMAVSIEIWQNDLTKHEALGPLLTVLRELVKAQTGEDPAF